MLESPFDLNTACFCVTLDRKRLTEAIATEIGDSEIAGELLQARPHLFSNVPVFMPRSEIDAMQTVVNAICDLAEAASFQEKVLSWAPQIARLDMGPKGAFMGFDFHIARDGPRLIEINTNAGGAFLNAALARAQRACCAVTRSDLIIPPPNDFEDAVTGMITAEWRLQRSAGALQRVAIVDENPAGQFLYPEFLLACELFKRHGIDAIVADPSDLRIRGNEILAANKPVDLVYNRLVDFAFESMCNATLQRAYVDGLAVVTPNPRTHALFANKRNFVLLSDEVVLAALGFPPAKVGTLTAAVPRTVEVQATHADELWRNRRNYFFKPFGGYGGKAVYRGDKLTRGVWEDILRGGYIAQALVPPSERLVIIDGATATRKIDVRLYTYGRKVFGIAARLYQGQTTNMRTPGGGFAPVFVVDHDGRCGDGDTSLSCQSRSDDREEVRG